MFRIFVCTLVLLLGFAAAALAWPTITVPDLTINGFNPSTTITLNVSGGDQIGVVDFVFQILEIGGPDITAVDITTGTIFDGNNNGQVNFGPDLPTQTAAFFTTVETGTVAASGVLATVTLQPAGFGTYHYRLNNVPTYGGIDFGDDPGGNLIVPSLVYTTTAEDGLPASFLFVDFVGPEPSTLLLGLLGIAMFGLWSLTHRRRLPVAHA